MNEWPVVRLDEIAAAEKSAVSKPYGSAIVRDDYVRDGVPVVRGVNLADWRFRDEDFVFISEDLADTMPGSRLQPGDLVFTHRGSVGQVSMIPRGPRFPRYAVSTSQVKARLDPARALAEFYFYWFRSPVGRASILQGVSTVGVPGLARPVETVKGLRVPLPPLSEQRRIASVLGALDDLIETSDSLARRLAELQAAAFLGAWDAVSRAKLADVATVTMGQSPPGDTYNESGEGTTFYQGVRDFGWRYPSRRVWTTQPTRLASTGDVLVAVRAPVGELNLATEATALGRGLAGLRAIGRQATLFQALQADSGVWDMHQGTGTVFASINKTGLSGLSIPWVDDDDLEARLTELDRAIRELTEESSSQRRTRDELLPLLMSGKVRVSEDLAVA